MQEFFVVHVLQVYESCFIWLQSVAGVFIMYTNRKKYGGFCHGKISDGAGCRHYQQPVYSF